MKHIVFRYIAIAATLLVTAVNASAQYNYEGGVGTSKQVTGPDTQGNYTIRLETFATGTTSVVMSAAPADIVLVLDLSQSMTSSYSGTTRLAALQSAVSDFLEVIYHNDNYQDNTNNKPRTDGPLGNRISIVTFGGPQNNTNVTRVNSGLTDVTNADGTKNTSMISDLLALNTGGGSNGINNADHYGTYADEGMVLANGVLNGIDATRKENSSRTVVLFTDGAPGSGPNWNSGNVTSNGQNSPSTADRTIKAARIAKTTHTATVFTVVLYSGTVPTAMSNYLQWTSSNYPNATGWDNGGTKESDSYAKEAGNDLSGIFTEIAHASGGAERPVGSNTQVRDVVTNSFVLPSTASAADVHVYTSAATGSASGADDTNPAGWANPVELTSGISIDIVNVDANGNPTQNANEVKNKALFVSGFDYSKADSAEGYGNWVGPRYANGNWIWAGKKLIITFKVKADGEATGGESLTNTGKSGVYVQNEDGKTYTPINYYEQPHTTLSVNIKIRKTGLRSGESATFELMRIRPKGYDPTGATRAARIANIEYNLIGKPKPDTHAYNGSAQEPDMSDYYEGMGWNGFKKVILTNKGADGAEVIKEIYALDPDWVYMVLEDDWGWAYTMTGDTNQVGDDDTYTTSSVEVNPFRFHNTEKEGAVKHAEAIMINHFKSDLSGAKVEHYKSSKVESFTSSK